MSTRLFPNGVGTRGIIAFALVGGFVVLCIMQRDVSLLKDAVFMALGYYFASRDASAQAARTVNGGG